MANFIRTKHYAYFCLGKKQKSKRKYRRPTGRHNKMRQKWKSRTPMVEIGYKNSDSVRGTINGKMPITVFNVNDLSKI
jgi:ribosomal protein L32E